MAHDFLGREPFPRDGFPPAGDHAPTDSDQGGPADDELRDEEDWASDPRAEWWSDARSVTIDNFHTTGNQLVGPGMVGDPHTSLGPGRPRQSRGGPIWPEETELVARTFVRPMGYLRARSSLMARRLVLLTGEPGSGKRTLALYLMHDRYLENVYAVDTVDDLMGLSVRRRTGYVVDTADPEGLDGYTPHDLELLRRRLTERDSVLLVTSSADAQTSVGNWAAWRVPCQRPDPIQVLRSHLTFHLGEDWERLHLDLVDEDIVEIARTDGRPDHAAAVARDLAELADGRFTRAEVLGALRDREHTAVEEWLRSHPTHEDWALMVATAVFEGQDYGIVTERAAALRSLLTRRLPLPDAEPAPDWPPRAREARLRSIHANRVEEDVSRGRVRYRLDRVRFDRPHWGAAVREHVWSVYPELRDVLVDWLAETPSHPADAHAAAARAVGDFIASGRGHQPLAPVGRWAREGGSKRLLAVLAMRAAAQDAVVATQVRHLLELWSRRQTRSDLRLTAALAYPGLASVYPDVALRHLLKLARTGEGKVADAARAGVLDLCRGGIDTGVVLERLEEWEEHGPAAELTAGLVRADPSDDVLTCAPFAAVVRRVVADRRGYPVVLRLFTDLLAETEGDGGLAARLREVFGSLFDPGRGFGLERLAYDLTRLAYEGLPDGKVLDIDVLTPAIDAFEEPITSSNGGVGT